MDCNKTEDIQTTDEENVLQVLISTEFQENIVNATNNTSGESTESRSIEFKEQNTNVESFADRECTDRECIEVLNFLKMTDIPLKEKSPSPCLQNSNSMNSSKNIYEKTHNNLESSLTTENCENKIKDVNVNLYKDNKSPGSSITENKLIPEACNAEVNTTVQPYVPESSNEMEVNGENIDLKSVNLRTHNEIRSNDFDTLLIRKLQEQVDETNVNQRAESCKMEEGGLLRIQSQGNAQILLIQSQDIAEQISDSNIEFTSVSGNNPDNRKRKISTAFFDNEQSFKDKILRSQEIQNKGSPKIQRNENTAINTQTESLKIYDKYAPTNPFASSLLISPLTSTELIADLQPETDEYNESHVNNEYDVQKIPNLGPTIAKHNENTFANYTENSVCSQIKSDINKSSPKADWCYTENETETVDCEISVFKENNSSSVHMMKAMEQKNTEQLLSDDEQEINEHKIFVTNTNQQYELDSSPRVNEQRNNTDVEKIGNSSYSYPYEKIYSRDLVTPIKTDITRDDEEMPMNEKIKTTECIILEEIHPSSTKNSRQKHLTKAHNWEQSKNQQISNYCNELMDITENSTMAQKRKFSMNFLGNESQPFNAKMVRSFKIQNKRNSPKPYNEDTHLTSKTKSFQICNKQTLSKTPIINSQTNPSENFEVDVLKLDSDERSLEIDEYHRKIKSNTILKSTATINGKNTFIIHTENCVNAPNNILDAAANCLYSMLSYIENETETIKFKTLAINSKEKPEDTLMTVPFTKKSSSQEVFTDISNITFDKTELHKTESAPSPIKSDDIISEVHDIAEYPELKMNQISLKTLEETFHSSSNHSCGESALTQDTTSINLHTSLDNISQTDGNHTLIQLYLENIEDQEFTVKNVVNFIQERDPSISYFTALHATRIFLKNALRNGKLKMVNGYYMISSSTENSTKSTLKCHLKKMINRQYSDIQTPASPENSILQENKALELTNEDPTTTNLKGTFEETHLNGTKISSLQDRHGSDDVNSDEKYLPK